MIAVTGATGHLGRLVIEALLDRDISPNDVVALVRSPEKAEDLAARGIHVRRADYNQPDALVAALYLVDDLLLVSSSEVGRRVVQHTNVIDAAVLAGVTRLAYTSVAHADTNKMLLAAEHRTTETLIRNSGIPYTFLRNSWYIENYTDRLDVILERGLIVGSAGGGRISAATRADYAEAAAVVLTSAGHEAQIYELGGDTAFTLDELAATISERCDRDVLYRDLPYEAHVEILVGAGLPKPLAEIQVDADLGIARGELFVDTRDLSRLIGHRTTTVDEVLVGAASADTQWDEPTASHPE